MKEEYIYIQRSKLEKEKEDLIKFKNECGYVYHQETEKRIDEIELELEYLI